MADMNDLIEAMGGDESTRTAVLVRTLKDGKVVKTFIDPSEDSTVYLTFDNGQKIKIMDAGRSCCESRYVTTDDNLDDLIGKHIHHIIFKDAPEIEDGYGTHEQSFVEIAATDGTCVTLVTHNEHNGYYGGFNLSVDLISLNSN